MSTAYSRPRLTLYLYLNFGFLLFLLFAQAIGCSPDPRVAYLIALFALCSTVVLDLDGLNGRYSLLAMFLLTYFIYFGVGDLSKIVYGAADTSSASILSVTEAVILVGAVMLLLGYRCAVSGSKVARVRSPPRDWSFRAITWMGVLLWAVGTFATYSWYTRVVTDTTVEGTREGLSALSPIATMAYLLAQMMQPLGVLLLAYAWRLRRNIYLSIAITGVVTIQVVLGFIIDIKGVALIAGILVIVTSSLIEGRIPKSLVALAALFIFLAFPVFQAYRAEVVGNRGIARTAALEHLADTLQIALAAKDKVNSGANRAQTFFERLSLKGSVQMIVERTGHGVSFQDGYTLTPILAAFVPRIFWSDKPDIPTGQIVNRVFYLSEQEQTYISPSHLGELYWNYGWPGVVVGMLIIGYLCGVVARYNLANARTVTRLLVTVLTVKQVIQGFEGSIASAYVVWLRSLAAVGLLHLFLARVPVRTIASASVGLKFDDLRPRPGKLASARAFPNLLG